MTINNKVSKYNGFAILNNHIVDYSTLINLNYMWNFGSLAGICLVIQIITGIFLAMHYTPHIDYAFVNIEHIIRDINNNWLIHYLHANVVSMFFINKQNKYFYIIFKILKYKR